MCGLHSAAPSSYCRFIQSFHRVCTLSTPPLGIADCVILFIQSVNTYQSVHTICTYTLHCSLEVLQILSVCSHSLYTLHPSLQVLKILSRCSQCTICTFYTNPSKYRYRRFYQYVHIVCTLSVPNSRYCRLCQSLFTICNAPYLLGFAASGSLVYTICALLISPYRYCRFCQSIQRVCGLSTPLSSCLFCQVCSYNCTLHPSLYCRYCRFCQFLHDICNPPDFAAPGSLFKQSVHSPLLPPGIADYVDLFIQSIHSPSLSPGIADSGIWFIQYIYTPPFPPIAYSASLFLQSYDLHPSLQFLQILLISAFCLYFSIPPSRFCSFLAVCSYNLFTFVVHYPPLHPGIADYAYMFIQSVHSSLLHPVIADSVNLFSLHHPLQVLQIPSVCSHNL